MAIRPLYIFLFLTVRGLSDVYRRQLLTSKDSPRTENVKKTVMSTTCNIKQSLTTTFRCVETDLSDLNLWFNQVIPTSCGDSVILMLQTMIEVSQVTINKTRKI